MKYIVLFCLITSLSIVINAQQHDYEFKKSKILNVDRDYKVIGEDSERVFMMEAWDSRYSNVVLYSGKLSAISKSTSEQLFNIYLDVDRSPKSVYYLNNEIIALYASNITEASSLELTIDRYSSLTGILIKSEVKVFGEGIACSKTRIVSSSNKKFNVLQTYCVSNNKSAIIVLDDNFEQINEYIFEDELITSNHYIKVDNEGSVFIFKKNKLLTFDANKDFDLWQETIKLQGLDTNGVLGGNIYGLRTKFDKDNNLYAVGFYVPNHFEDKNGWSPYSKSYSENIFTMKINGFSHEVEYINLIEFGYQLRHQMQMELLLKDDLGFVILLEDLNYFSDDETGDLKILDFNSSGKMISEKKVLKQIYSRIRSYRGFLCEIKDNQLMLLYNTHVKNVDFTEKHDSLVKQYRLEYDNNENRTAKDYQKYADKSEKINYVATSENEIVTVLTKINLENNKRSEKVIYSIDDFKISKTSCIPISSYFLEDKLFFFGGKHGYNPVADKYLIKKIKYSFISF